MTNIARLFVSITALLLGIACGRPDDPAKPPVVALPPEAAGLAVQLDPAVRWAAPYNAGVQEWGKRLMLELPIELKAHGFTLVPDRALAAAVLVVGADAGTTVTSPIAVDLMVADIEPGHGDSKISVTASEPEFAARTLVNDLVASTYFNDLARRHAKPRDGD